MHLQVANGGAVRPGVAAVFAACNPLVVGLQFLIVLPDGTPAASTCAFCLPMSIKNNNKSLFPTVMSIHYTRFKFTLFLMNIKNLK